MINRSDTWCDFLLSSMPRGFQDESSLMTSTAKYKNHSVALKVCLLKLRTEMRAGRRDIVRAARTRRVIFERSPCLSSSVVSYAVVLSGLCWWHGVV